MAAAAGTTAATVAVDRQNFRIEIGEPYRRRRRRRAENDLQARIAKDFYRPVEPGEISAAGTGLDLRPGELADADIREAERLHARGVVGPHLFGPLLRVVADAEHLSRLMQQQRQESRSAPAAATSRPRASRPQVVILNR